MTGVTAPRNFCSLQLYAHALLEIAMRWWQSLLLYWNRWNEVI